MTGATALGVLPTTLTSIWRLTDDRDRIRLDRLAPPAAYVKGRRTRTCTGVFERRLAALHGEAADARSALLADSLVADLAEATRKAREMQRLLAKLREQLAELRSFSSARARVLVVDLEAAIASSDISRAHSLLAAAAEETAQK